MKKYIVGLLLIPALVFGASSGSRTLLAQFLKNGAGILTLPTSTDTLVGRATTDIFTNKTIDGGSNTFTNLNASSITTGTMPISGGGTNNSSLAVTAGGALYTDGSKLVNVGAGTQNQFLLSNAASPPTWNSFVAPTVQTFLLTNYYTFSLSTLGTATAGATYTSNGHTFTVIYTLALGGTMVASANGAPSGSGFLTKTGGTGDGTLAFASSVNTGQYQLPTSPRSPIYIRVRMVGAGGGGGGSGTGSPGTGGTGTTTTFGSSLLSAGAGSGGSGTGGNQGGSGGTASLGSGPVGLAISGSTGGGNSVDGSVTLEYGIGGMGGSSAFGGAGGSGPANGAGGLGIANTGGGGGGAGAASTASANTGAGGGSGAFIDAIIGTLSSTYVFNLGAGGTGGGAGTSGGFAGGAGGSGMIEVTEYYQ